MNLSPAVVSEERGNKKEMRALYGSFALLAVGFLVYSQTLAFHWDEGFHILTAHLINMGKRPYLDFFFQQTPLNAYWNAMWMRIFGPSWRAVHAIAALATVGSVFLIVQYLFVIFPDRRWRPAIAFAAMALFGLHALVWEFGAVSQAYPLCLLLLVAAFRAAVVAVARPQATMSALAGLFCGAAAASSLLTAPAAAAMLIWIWLNNRSGSRWSKTAAFGVGVLAPWAPVLILFAHGPREVIFNILKYHLIYRRMDWDGATGHDIDVITSWINSSPSLLVVMLAFAGLFAVKKMGFEGTRRSEFRLCLWLAVAIGVQNLAAHPTFPQYFIFLLPFLTVIAAIGFYAVAVRLGDPNRPGPAVIVMLCTSILCCCAGLYHMDADSSTWPQLERVSDKVRLVTPNGAALFAPEQIYFLSRWSVPPGMENSNTHNFSLPPTENTKLHIISKEELDRRIKSGDFATAVVCDDDEANELEEWNVYTQKDNCGDCTIFWQFEKKADQLQAKP